MSNMLLPIVLITVVFAAGQVNAQALDVVVETVIKPQGVAGWVSGMKSKHTVTLDIREKSASDKFSTGTTLGLPSIRDDFTYDIAFVSDQRVRVRMKGETASAVQVMPNINYSLEFQINYVQGKVWLSGCHDGFPSYIVSLRSTMIYLYEQSKNPGDLIGECDTTLLVDGASF